MKLREKTQRGEKSLAIILNVKNRSLKDLIEQLESSNTEKTAMLKRLEKHSKEIHELVTSPISNYTKSELNTPLDGNL